MNPDVWNEKVGPHDWRWELAEQTCREITRSLGPYGKFISGHGVSPPWVVNHWTDRVVAYHGFQGTWVGWERGGPVIPLKLSEAIRFLKGGRPAAEVL